MNESALLGDLLAQSRSLEPVPFKALQAYRAVMQSLAIEVTRQVSEHPRYAEFLGGAPASLFADNHRNHVQFMEEVLASGHYDLLALTLPWVYHAYHSQGVHYDYFSAELSLWRRAVATALPHEAATPIGAVYDCMLAWHDLVVKLAELRGSASEDVKVAPDLAGIFEALTEALLDGDDARVLSLCRGAQDAGMSLPELLQGLIYPAMQRVGTLWECGRISVADEHQATAIMNRVLAAIYYDQSFPDRRRGRALVGACVNEFHEMGADACLDDCEQAMLWARQRFDEGTGDA